MLAQHRLLSEILCNRSCARFSPAGNEHKQNSFCAWVAAALLIEFASASVIYQTYTISHYFLPHWYLMQIQPLSPSTAAHAMRAQSKATVKLQKQGIKFWMPFSNEISNLRAASLNFHVIARRYGCFRDTLRTESAQVTMCCRD